MGWTTTRPELLERAVRAVGEALAETAGPRDVAGAVAALQSHLG